MVKFDKIYTQFVEILVLLFLLNCERRLIVVLEHISEALTEYLGQNVPSLASYSVNVYIYKTKVWVYKLKHDL
jgi:hypothetical protein